MVKSAPPSNDCRKEGNDIQYVWLGVRSYLYKKGKGCNFLSSGEQHSFLKGDAL